MNKLSLFIILVILSGCAGVVEPEPFIPTAAPTHTPTVTHTPTITPSPTITNTPTRFPTPTAQSATEIFGATNTPLAVTHTPTREPGAPEIEYFVTSSVEVAPGDNVTLLWSLRRADAATIYRLDEEGERRQFWNVDARGRLVVATRSTDADRARFALVVGDEANEIEEILTVPLTGCQGQWFFEPAPESCAVTPPTYTLAAEQAFERGRMVWLQAEGSIYILFNDDQSPAWTSFEDQFIEGATPESSPEFEPPDGNLLQPVRGFGLVWRENESVRTRLGWATQPEQAFDGAIQAELGGTLYMRSANGTILVLAPEGESWTELAP